MRAAAILGLAFLLAGCARPLSDTPTPPPSAPYTVESVPIQAHGHLGEILYWEGQAVPAANQSGAMLNNGPTLFWVKGNVSAIDLDVTWTTASEATRRLEVWVLAATESLGGRAAVEPRVLADVAGTSPLHVAVGNVTLGDQHLAIFVWPAAAALAGGSLRSSVEQPFEVAGTATLHVPASLFPG
ncbi:MAG: hypothetical protein LC620_00340 [Halobacteriales archaeon]|nr:hypothetical protein [Halobacteriales archaeon]